MADSGLLQFPFLLSDFPADDVQCQCAQTLGYMMEYPYYQCNNYSAANEP